jgi:hypothetical protein
MSAELLDCGCALRIDEFGQHRPGALVGDVDEIHLDHRFQYPVESIATCSYKISPLNLRSG